MDGSDQEDEVPNVNFVPSLLFVKRGVAKANPDKVSAWFHSCLGCWGLLELWFQVTLTPGELARIINDTRDDLEEDGAEGMDTSDDEENEESAARLVSRAETAQASGSSSRAAATGGDEFGFEGYEQECKWNSLLLGCE